MSTIASKEIKELQESEDTFARWMEDRMNEYQVSKEDIQSALSLGSLKKAARIVSGEDAYRMTLDELKNLARLFNVDPFDLWEKYGLGNRNISSGELRIMVQEGGYKIGRFVNAA